MWASHSQDVLVYSSDPFKCTTRIAGDVSATSLRIEVASTNFPNYERNLNTGGHNFDETAARVARNRVVHTARDASHRVHGDATLMRRG